LVFAQPRRLIREKPDIDFIVASVKENEPYCCITINDYQEKKFGTLFDIYSEYIKSSITHLGIGDATYQITGNHQGNNSFQLKISSGGIIGDSPAPQYRLKINDGSYSDPADIPDSGKILIGDGTTFEFTVGGTVVAGDAYSWTTTAQRVNVYKEKEITFKLRADIWTKTKKELFMAGGYFDQLSRLMIDRYVTDGEQVIYVSPSPSRWIQSEFEQENNLIRGAQEIAYQGAIYTQKVDALITQFLYT
jgi:hypothetical protein